MTLQTANRYRALLIADHASKVFTSLLQPPIAQACDQRLPQSDVAACEVVVQHVWCTGADCSREEPLRISGLVR